MKQQKVFLWQELTNEQAAAALTAAVIQAANELDLFILDIIAQFETTRQI